MILICKSCGVDFKPYTRHMRYFRGDIVNCPMRCSGHAIIIDNIIPEQDLEIIKKGDNNAVEK